VVATPSLTAMVPVDGYYAFSTPLDITGTGFIPQAPECLFDNTPSTATYISATKVSCIAPPVSAATIATVQVRFECTGISSANVDSLFTYHGVFN